MRKNSLSNKGLSLSQAQSISNLCNQSAIEITAKLTGVNNFSKTVKIGEEDKIIINGKQLPENVIDLLGKKAKLHACQAFLMENIKTKEVLLENARNAVADVSAVEFPTKPTFIDPVVNYLSNVNEEFGWEQLTASEINEYLEAESFAAHIGQFIHKGGTLSRLRNELPDIPAIEWMTIKDGEKSPVTINIHHDSDKLLDLHNKLASAHREYEQRVNYFKAKVKNLTTLENARIAKHNADAQNAAAKTNNELQLTYETAMKKATEEANDIRVEFEKIRQARIAEIAATRINVDARFQDTIDEFLTKLPETKE